MAIVKVYEGMSLIGCNMTWICRAYVSATSSSQAAKIDKETCEKVIDAADTVKDGTKTMMAADVAGKGFEKAAESAETQKCKDVLDTAKVASEAFKKRVSESDD